MSFLWSLHLPQLSTQPPLTPSILMTMKTSRS